MTLCVHRVSVVNRVPPCLHGRTQIHTEVHKLFSESVYFRGVMVHVTPAPRPHRTRGRVNATERVTATDAPYVSLRGQQIRF